MYIFFIFFLHICSSSTINIVVDRIYQQYKEGTLLVKSKKAYYVFEGEVNK